MNIYPLIDYSEFITGPCGMGDFQGGTSILPKPERECSTQILAKPKGKHPVLANIQKR